MKRWLMIIVGFLFAFGGFALLVGDNGLMHLYRVKQEKARMEARIQQLQVQQAEYREKIAQLNSDPATIEREIREQLKFVREDETVFLLPQTQAGEP
jgi:cell division protein FtsB